MTRHGLTDREWARLEPLLPRRSRMGRPPKDHRLVLDALLWLAKTGAPWRDLPERYGPWRTVATRFYRWTRSGLWERILSALRRLADARGGTGWEVHVVDAASVRAHRHAAGAKGGAAPPGVGALARRLRQQAAPALRPARPAHGLRADPGRAERALRPAGADGAGRGPSRRPGGPRTRSRALVGDRGYTGRPARDFLRRRGVAAVIPQFRTEKRPRLMDWDLYRERNVVERLVGRLK